MSITWKSCLGKRALAVPSGEIAFVVASRRQSRQNRRGVGEPYVPLVTSLPAMSRQVGESTGKVHVEHLGTADFFFGVAA